MYSEEVIEIFRYKNPNVPFFIALQFLVSQASEIDVKRRVPFAIEQFTALYAKFRNICNAERKGSSFSSLSRQPSYNYRRKVMPKFNYRSTWWFELG